MSMSKKPLTLTKTKNNFQEFLKGLQGKYNIKFLYAEFSGSGDSGEIHELYGTLHEDHTIGTSLELSDDDRETALSFFDNYLESTGYDWYNNDGGFGNIILNLETGEIKCEMNVNVMTSEEYQLEDAGDYVKNYEI